MKNTLILLATLCLIHSSSASAQSAPLAADLQAIDASHWPAINTLLIAQRNELNAAHVAQIATLTSESKTQLKATTAERDEAVEKLNALQTQITSILSSQLSELAPQLTAAQAALAAELTTGEGPQAAAKRLIVTALQARIDTLNSLTSEAGKSDKQKDLEAAQAAKEAADKVLLEAQAALNR